MLIDVFLLHMYTKHLGGHASLLLLDFVNAKVSFLLVISATKNMEILKHIFFSVLQSHVISFNQSECFIGINVVMPSRL